MTPDEKHTEPSILGSQPPESHLHIVRRLRRALLSVNRCGDAIFSPYRLTTDQYSLLRAVQRQPGIRQADLCNFIFAEPNTITAMVSLLEKRGILRRRSCPTDGRVRLLHLTAHGQNVLQRLTEDWRPMRKVLINCFAGEEGENALLILDRVFEKMQREREKFIERLDSFQQEEPISRKPVASKARRKVTESLSISKTSQAKFKIPRVTKEPRNLRALVKDR
jgi:DNA-binding MarR family transcriptional regulator